MSLNNKEIFDFYKKNNLDFEEMNILFMGILKKLGENIDVSLNASLASELIEKFKKLDAKIDATNNKIQQTVQDYNKDNVENVRQMIMYNTSETIVPLIKESSGHVLDKTSLMLSEIIPKNDEKLIKNIETQFMLFQNTLVVETNKFLSLALDKKSIDDFFHSLIQNVGMSHNTLVTLLSSSESKIENRLTETERKMGEIKELTNTNNISQLSLYNNVSEVLKKFEKGSSRGNVSEHIIYNILLGLFPCAQIDHVGNEQKETGDIILIRSNKPKILIENKDHTSTNVPKTDVDKFIRDCEIQNCSGIMFSQHRGISNKQNFELQLNNGNVLLYVHEVGFDKDKIKIAIEIVEQFKMKIDDNFNNEEDCMIDKDSLNEINKECLNYVLQKGNLLKLLKDYNEKMSQVINELRFPTLEKYLSTKFATSSVQSENICKYCEMHVPKSLSQHYRYCKAKKLFETTS
jgi:hypothetical protein